jgi:hypothetical protein
MSDTMYQYPLLCYAVLQQVAACESAGVATSIGGAADAAVPDLSITFNNKPCCVVLCCAVLCCSKWQHATLLELVVLPMLPYLTWSVCYYLKIFVVSAEKIK